MYNMEKQLLISVIVPIYNVEGYLPRCLETIAQQSYRYLEMILIDDGSTDNSGVICDQYAAKDERVTVIHQQNLGLWAARNAGQRIAKGAYLMFVDGDDYLHLDTLKIVVESIDTNNLPDVVLIDFIRTSILHEEAKQIDHYRISELSQDQLIHSFFTYNGRDGVSPNVWNKLYKRTLICDIYAKDYPRAQDMDFNIRVFLKCTSAIRIHEKLYYWVQRPTSLMHQEGYWDIAYSCLVKMYYTNYIHLPSDKRKYAHYLLRGLFIKMLYWKNRMYKKDNQEIVFEQCKKYERAMRKEYWQNRNIRFLEKVEVTIMLFSPRLTHWLMKVTKRDYGG